MYDQDFRIVCFWPLAKHEIKTMSHHSQKYNCTTCSQNEFRNFRLKFLIVVQLLRWVLVVYGKIRLNALSSTITDKLQVLSLREVGEGG